MRPVFIYISSFHGAAFRISLFKNFLDGIACLIPSPEVDPLMVVSSLCEIQEELLFPRGPLYENLVAWLVSTNHLQNWICSGLIGGLSQYFMAEEHSEESPTIFSDMKVRILDAGVANFGLQS